jgi:hypothetical protein
MWQQGKKQNKIDRNEMREFFLSAARLTKVLCNVHIVWWCKEIINFATLVRHKFYVRE